MTSERDRIRGLRGRPAEPGADAAADAAPERGDVIIEFAPRGGYVRVCAIDVATGVEAAIVGDPAVGEAALKRLALRKLDYVMRTRKRGL